MALFFHEKSFSNGARKKGFPRYCEILERDGLRFIVINIITLVGITPFFIGVLYALLSSSLLILVPSCIIGGAIAGPFLSGLLDSIFRSMRDSNSHCLRNYRKALWQNAAESIFTGIIVFSFIGIYAFLIMIWWTTGFPSITNIILAVLSLIAFISFSTIYWCQIVLFRQSVRKRVQNTILFMVKYFWKSVGTSILHAIYLTLGFLFLPYTLLLVPLLGLWFIAYLSIFVLYNSIDTAFSLETQLADYFPEQVPFYETDEEWLQRKMK